MTRLFERFLADRRGGVALVMGLTAPVLVLGAAAAVEYGNIARRKTQLQYAADSAALRAANELTLANSDTYVQNLAETVAFDSAKGTDAAITRVKASIQNKRSWVNVEITETVKSVIGKVLTLPSSEVQVTSTGQIVGLTRLCLLALDPKAKDTLHLHKSAAITASGCALYSNSRDQSSVKIEENATVNAALVCSAGGIKQSAATISGQTMTDCPVKSDPLASRTAPPMSGCDFTGLKIEGGTRTLTPGRYCDGLDIKKGAQVTLSPGVYIIDNGALKVSGSSTFKGEYVGFYFMGDKGGLVFDPKSTIDLSAPKDGPLVGLLFFEQRTVSNPVEPVTDLLAPVLPPPLGSAPMRTYRIVSDNARNLLGTIYLPAGRLVVDAKQPIADRSAYTIIVAKQVDLYDGPHLYLNTNYGSTDVPVPSGVGPSTPRSISLVQ